MNVFSVPNHGDRKGFWGKKCSNKLHVERVTRYVTTIVANISALGVKKELKCSLQFLLQRLSTQGLLSPSPHCFNLDVMWSQDNLFCCLFQRHLLFSAHWMQKEGESSLVLCIYQINFRKISTVSKGDLSFKKK